MRSARITISLDKNLVTQLDRLVLRRVYPNRRQAIQSAVEEKVERLERRRLARECAKLDPKEEQAMAEEGFQEDMREWPEY